VSSSGSAVLATAGAGTIYLRPNGGGSTTAQASYSQGGDLTVANNITANAQITAGGPITTTSGAITAPSTFQSSTASLVLAAQVGAIYFRPNGAGSGTGQCNFDQNGNLIIAGPTGQKSTGTTWSNPSDARLKEVKGPYEGGLAEILQVEPVIYQLLAHPEYGDQIGVIGQEIEEVMPETITLVEGTIEREGETITVPDLRQFDANAILWALVNAVKELEARVAILEVG